MAKGEWSLEKIAVVLLIVVVLIIVIPSYSSGIKQTAKQLLGFGDEIIDYTKVNENAYNGFNDLVKNIADCRGLNDKKCGCKVDLSQFSYAHVLNFTKGEAKMHFTKERSNLLMGSSLKLNEKDKKSMEGLNCYILGLGVENGDKKTGALEINFDGKGAFIKKGGLASINIFDDEGGKLRLGKALQVYKDDKNVLCWITVESKYAIKSCGEKEKV